MIELVDLQLDYFFMAWFVDWVGVVFLKGIDYELFKGAHTEDMVCACINLYLGTKPCCLAMK
jgi:hypothetical protein